MNELNDEQIVGLVALLVLFAFACIQYWTSISKKEKSYYIYWDSESDADFIKFVWIEDYEFPFQYPYILRRTFATKDAAIIECYLLNKQKHENT